MKQLVTLALAVCLLASCSTTNTVYRIGDGWSKMPAKSAMTGTAYSK